MRTHGFVLTFGAVALIGAGVIGAKEAAGLRLAGVVLHSFNEPHGLIQSGPFIYRICKEAVSPAQVSQLDRIGSRVSLDIPEGAVDFAWAAAPALAERPKGAPASSVAEVRNGKIRLSGVSLPSFEAAHLLVQVGSDIYRIDSKQVDPKLYQRKSPGEHIALTIPASAVLHAWRAAPDRGPASYVAQPADAIVHSGGQVLIRGRLLQSMSDPHVLIQSGESIYQVKRAQLSGVQARSVDQIGNRVDLKIPVSSIDYAWKVQPGPSNRILMLGVLRIP